MTALFRKAQKGARRFDFLIYRSVGTYPWLKVVIYLLTIIVSLYFITFKLYWKEQLIVSTPILLLMLIIYKWFPKERIFMLTLSFALSFRYFYWRATETINTYYTASFIVSVILLLAELYGFLVLILGYFEIIEPINRKPVPLPDDISKWPTVDIFIPTYDEPLEVLRPTIAAALAIDYPKKKVYVLDDGRRPEVKKLAEELGAHYITRETNEGAKAGNINHALKLTNGDLIAIFDADHVPTRSFLQMTVGFFLKDPKLALVQTPHHFYNPDVYERNLYLEKVLPEEQQYFYHLVQPGKDLWNAVYFCGSCAVLKRKALEEIGGIAQDTVTEDAHTSIKLHARGWNSVYLGIPQAAGIATDRYAYYVSQRGRWTRGMIQIFRLDNPLFKKGLTIPQRLAYLNSMIHFFSGYARIVFILAPLSYLLFGVYPLIGTALDVVAYAFPHLIGAVLTGSLMSKNVRHSFWTEIYETARSYYSLVISTVTLINPRKGRFVVTPKVAKEDEYYFDIRPVRPLLALLALTILGIIFTPIRWKTHPDEIDAVLINGFWNLFNFFIVLASTFVAFERPQRRRYYRVEVDLPCQVWIRSKGYIGKVEDLSEGGAKITLNKAIDLPKNVDLIIFGKQGKRVFVKAEVAWYVKLENSTIAGLKFNLTDEDIETRKDIIQLIYSPADKWIYTEAEEDNPLKSLGRVLTTPVRVVSHMVKSKK